MQLSTHLHFNGQCEEAFRTYQRVLGGKITTMLTYGDSPLAEGVDPKWHKRMLHATLNLGSHELFGADVFSDNYERPQGFSVTLSIGDLERAKQVFDSLAEGGTVLMPFQETFWSPGFGVLADRFAVPWEIQCEPSSAYT